MRRSVVRGDLDNPQHPKVAAAILLDTSASMREGSKLIQVIDGLHRMVEELGADPLAYKRVELALVTFGKDVEIAHQFSSISRFTVPEVSPAGFTPMARGIHAAVDLVENRKSMYRTWGVDYYRPWIFMLTDGEPTDMRPGDAIWNDVQKVLHQGEEKRRFVFLPVMARPGNGTLIEELTHPSRPPVQLEGFRFNELFQWLSRSLVLLSASRPGERVALDPIRAWAAV